MRTKPSSPIVRFAALRSLAKCTSLVASVAALAGCPGVYAEIQASAMPGLKYNAPDTTSTSTPTFGASPVSGGYGVGLGLGVDFDFDRNSRLAVGYHHDSMSFGGAGGSASMDGADLRFDFNVSNMSDDLKLRVALGVTFASGETKMTAADGTTVSSKTSSNAGTTGEYAGYAGVAVAYYLGTHQTVQGMVGAQFVGMPAPGGGTLTGAGVVVKLTYTFDIGNNRPDTVLTTRLDTDASVEAVARLGADKLGCKGRDRTWRGFDYFETDCRSVGGVDMMWLQASRSVAILCRHSTEATCKEWVGKVADAAGTSTEGHAAKRIDKPVPTPVPSAALIAPAPSDSVAPPAPPSAPAIGTDGAHAQ
ncbi:MAG: hypothetical protein ACHREM_06795 [Polyangiales bacterium]